MVWTPFSTQKRAILEIAATSVSEANSLATPTGSVLLPCDGEGGIDGTDSGGGAGGNWFGAADAL